MPDEDLQYLLERIGADEDAELEYKGARDQLPSTLWETVSAFANTRGGWIVLGVKDGRPPRIEGVSDPRKLVKSFFDTQHTRNKLSRSMCNDDDVTIHTMDEVSIVAIRVPVASRHDRPVYIDGNALTGTYIRRGEGDYRCSPAEVQIMIRDSAIKPPDTRVLSDFDLQDLETTAVATYRQLFRSAKPSHVWNRLDDAAFLQAVGAAGQDRQRGTMHPTVAGLLMLGKEEAIRAWRFRHLIDFRVWNGDYREDRRWDHREDWGGNLLSAFNLIYPQLTSGLQVPFALSGAFRSSETAAHVALRESLVNLLIHADYAEQTPSLIEKSSVGYSFRNPGASLLPRQSILDGKLSALRNPGLAFLFRMIGLAEEAGSGIVTIVHSWRSLGLQMPTINSGAQRHEFELHLRNVHLLEDIDRAWLLRMGQSFTESEQLALVEARLSERVSNASLRTRTALHPTDATTCLTGLRNGGFLERFDSGRAAYYTLSQTARDALQHAQAEVSGQMPLPLTIQHVTPHDADVDDDPSLGHNDPGLGHSDVSLGDNDPSLGHNDLSLEDNDPSLGDNDVRLGHSDPSFRDNDPSFGSNTLSSGESGRGSSDARAELRRIAHPMRMQARVSAQTRDRVILELCAIQALSAQDIRGLIERDMSIVHDALRKLVRQGALVQTFPEQPTHPQQRYRAAHPKQD